MNLSQSFKVEPRFKGLHSFSKGADERHAS